MIQSGSLVRLQDNKLGIGKVTQILDTQVTVEYFYSVAQRLKKSLTLNSLRPVRLQPQTRCYIWNESQETWTIGRIYQWDDDICQYQIDLPDRQTMLAREQDVFVRCNLSIADPIETLVMKGQETPYFHDKRLSLVQCLIEQRAISRGMTGLISANIKLYSHQVEVVRRVLEDPIQRYLLADEVGLGKTIEAGAILRQYLIDEPSGRALVLVPQYLQEQWQTELEHKFYISHFGDRVKVFAVEDVNQVGQDTDFGLLIIDEAHHIAAMAISSETNRRRCFEICKHLANKSDRLLLLSATPVLNHEQDFLVMLHLLDPVTYRLDDLEGFRIKVQKRSLIGRVLLSFREGAKAFVLKTSLNQLRNLFTEDKCVLQLAEELQNALQANATDTNKIVRAIRIHISETYRLHRRMLRNRRAGVADVIFDRNVTPKVEYDIDERTYTIHELIDNWRTIAPQQEEYGRIFLLLFQASGTLLEILQQVITARLGSKSSAALNREFGTDDVRILTEFPLFEEEQEILQSLLKIIQQPSEDGDRKELLKIVILNHLSQSLGLQSFRSNISKLLERVQQRISRPIPGDKLPKIVIFTSFVQVGAEIVRFLKNNFGQTAVASHLFGQSRTQVEQNLKQFKNDASCFILVCDPSGEEGRNLQFVDWTIHFDLPWSPNRLEQRIGRIDRIGRPLKVEFTVFAGTDLPDSPHNAVYQLLKEGFRIFQQSIASLQFYVDEKQSVLEATLFQSGANGLLDLIAVIQEEITEEEVKISEQNVLDEIDAQDESVYEYFQALDDYDANHQKIQRAIEGWLKDALQFQQINDPNMSEVKLYIAKKHTLLPADHVQSQFARPLKQSGTYNRRVANQNKDIKIYRNGEALVESLASYIRWDDRGKAFAMWRTDESWDKSEGMEWFGFRFNYTVESNLATAKEVFQNYRLNDTKYKSLKRRTDALFPPLVKTVFIDARYEPMCIVEDEALLNLLHRNYNGKSLGINRDYNLAKRRLAILNQFVAPSQWQNFCRQARSSSEELLRKRPEFIELCQERSLLAEKKLETRLNQLRLRLMRLSETEPISNSLLAKEVDIETALSQAILKGIRHPDIRLDSVGFIILSGRPPVQSEEEGDN
ncbi:protein DpdE [Scytonema sp. NUACC26]|uniref:protein DpdE n=1 Tax=Scytonema sp. NUACC26 TaxID=3140176 RepID=UPI0034DBA120